MYHTQQQKVAITIIKRLKNIDRWKKARCGYLGNNIWQIPQWNEIPQNKKINL